MPKPAPKRSKPKAATQSSSDSTQKATTSKTTSDDDTVVVGAVSWKIRERRVFDVELFFEGKSFYQYAGATSMKQAKTIVSSKQLEIEAYTQKLDAGLIPFPDPAFPQPKKG